MQMNAWPRLLPTLAVASIVSSCKPTPESLRKVTQDEANWTSTAAIMQQTVAGVAVVISLDQCDPSSCQYGEIAGRYANPVSVYGMEWENLAYGDGPAQTFYFAQNAPPADPVRAGVRYVVTGFGIRMARACVGRAGVAFGLANNDPFGRLTMAAVTEDDSYEIVVPGADTLRFTIAQFQAWAAEAKASKVATGEYPPGYSNDNCTDAGSDDGGEDASP